MAKTVYSQSAAVFIWMYFTCVTHLVCQADPLKLEEAKKRVNVRVTPFFYERLSAYTLRRS